MSISAHNGRPRLQKRRGGIQERRRRLLPRLRVRRPPVVPQSALPPTSSPEAAGLLQSGNCSEGRQQEDGRRTSQRIR